ncbi:YtxH domain-containing protein [Bacillus marasmi]|uniref:YtxH domain-containing protein n=1 Tax=Bacillus marasmi TaxID=1926279 RepID=UPI0011C97022|nr:YtxH domain-containing protein [Bacillus marasmi]
MSNYLHEEKEKNGTKDFLLGALIGGVVGAATALFLSPKSGPELRESVTNQTAVLKEKAVTIPSKVSDLAQATKEKTSTLTQTISQQSAEAIAKLRGKKSETTEELDEFEELEASAEFQQTGYDSIQQMLEETKKAFDETEKKLNH